jgi:hypothetical protein
MVLNPSKPKKKGKSTKAKKATKHAPKKAASKNRKAKKNRATRYVKNPGRRHARGAAAGSLASPLPLPKLGKLDMGFAIVTGVGVVGHGIATNFIADKVPVAQLKSGAGKFGLGLGLAIAGSWAAFAFLPKKFATPLSVGMGTSVVVQGLNTFVFPKFPQLPVSGYESIDMLSGYEEVPGTDPGAFAGLEADRFESAFA